MQIIGQEMKMHHVKCHRTLLNIQKVRMKLPELGIFLRDYANLQLRGLEVHVQDR